MTLEEFARTILFGNTLQDKLVQTPSAPFAPATGKAPLPLTDLPAFPGRPASLARVGKAEFPRPAELARDSARGRVLHFFANHELLAMELMALVLLRFPEAPEPFRAGLVRTIAEEQGHMRLYIERMRELGVGFGELPVSDYFWKAIRGARSPLEFVTQMSLTLEQANLDYSLYFMREAERVGDAKTAALLERVYREEIGHVKHGVAWFNRWRAGDPESDWAAYLRLLPPPMTPRRAKGLGFTAEGRREAGLSEEFIRNLEVYGGSKGRPPAFWHYNPLCDAEIARGRPGLNPPETVRRLSLDLEHLPMFLARETDVVLAERMPRPEWLRGLREAGFALPEFREAGRPAAPPREDKIAGFEPWGWSPESFGRFKPWRERLIAVEGANGAWARGLLDRAGFDASGLAPLFSKAWSAAFLREWLERNPEAEAAFGNAAQAGEAFADWPALRARVLSRPEGHFLAKAPYGTSGSGNRRLLRHDELDGPLGGWLRNTMATQGAVVLEPWLDKIADLSIQLEIQDAGPRALGVRRFVNGARQEYRGTILDHRLTSLGEEALRFLHAGAPASPLQRWERLALELGRKLRGLGYRGPAGIDALLYRLAGGALALKPVVELNPRWTMGRVALALEKHVTPGVPAAWLFVPLRSSGVDASALASSLARAHPLERAPGGAISRGALMTNDPERAREALTVLAVGPDALSDPRLTLPPDPRSAAPAART